MPRVSVTVFTNVCTGQRSRACVHSDVQTARARCSRGRGDHPGSRTFRPALYGALWDGVSLSDVERWASANIEFSFSGRFGRAARAGDGRVAARCRGTDGSQAMRLSDGKTLGPLSSISATWLRHHLAHRP